MYVCPYDTCLGGNVTHHSFKKVTYTKKRGYGTDYHSHDTSQCRAGSEGPLCAVCQEGFKIDRGTRRCEKCAVSGVQQAGIVAFLGLIVVLLLVSLSKRLREILTWEAHTVEMLMMVVTTIQMIQRWTDNFEWSMVNRRLAGTHLPVSRCHVFVRPVHHLSARVLQVLGRLLRQHARDLVGPARVHTSRSATFAG